jgi:four helix bundle protein
MELAEAAYRATEAFPVQERYGLASQLRRSSVSIPSNIAEGFGRGRKAEFQRFLEMARASLFELQTQAELARRLGWVKGNALADLRERTHELDAILGGLIRSARDRTR